MSIRFRTAVPADRHKRAVAFRHPHYVKKPIRNVAENEKTNEVVNEIKETKSVSVVRESEKKVDTTVTESFEKEDKPTLRERMKQRKERRNTSRLMEIDAILSRKKFNPLKMIFFPNCCMESEAGEEINCSNIHSLARILIKWLIVSSFIAERFRAFVSLTDFSFMRLSWSHSSGIALRLTITFFAGEILAYVILWALSLLTVKPFSLKRLFATESVGWLAQVVAFVFAGIVGMKSPIGGIICTVGAFFYGILIQFLGYGYVSRRGKDWVSGTFVAVILLYSIFVFRVFKVTEVSLIQLLIDVMK